ncbi:MAG: hypothetical protein IT463_07250 [Planctomycetes bacterium]|nr:hypothetical protein [Planctomycetota bacterium]
MAAHEKRWLAVMGLEVTPVDGWRVHAPPGVSTATGALITDLADAGSRYLCADLRYMPPQAGYDVSGVIYGAQPGLSFSGNHYNGGVFDPGTGVQFQEGEKKPDDAKPKPEPAPEDDPDKEAKEALDKLHKERQQKDGKDCICKTEPCRIEVMFTQVKLETELRAGTAFFNARLTAHVRVVVATTGELAVGCHLVQDTHTKGNNWDFRFKSEQYERARRKLEPNYKKEVVKQPEGTDKDVTEYKTKNDLGPNMPEDSKKLNRYEGPSFVDTPSLDWSVTSMHEDDPATDAGPQAAFFQAYVYVFEAPAVNKYWGFALTSKFTRDEKKKPGVKSASTTWIGDSKDPFFPDADKDDYPKVKENEWR